MEDVVAIRGNRTVKRLGALIALGAAAFLMLMKAHTAYGAGGLALNTDYPGISVKPGDNLNIPVML